MVQLRTEEAARALATVMPMLCNAAQLLRSVWCWHQCQIIIRSESATRANSCSPDIPQRKTVRTHQAVDKQGMLTLWVVIGRPVSRQVATLPMYMLGIDRRIALAPITSRPSPSGEGVHQFATSCPCCMAAVCRLRVVQRATHVKSTRHDSMTFRRGHRAIRCLAGALDSAV